MKTLTYILLIIALGLGGVVAALWLQSHFQTSRNNATDKRYGLFEGREVVGKSGRSGEYSYIVEDEDGNKLFNIPLRNCMIDERYRDGRLRFRENETDREGYIDRYGIVTFLNNGTVTPGKLERKTPSLPELVTAQRDGVSETVTAQKHAITNSADLRNMARNNPFYKEAVKILSGSLGEDDAQKRRMILDYCEHLRTAYTTKDIDFLRQVFSEQALIIVGNVVKAKPGADNVSLDADMIVYNLRSKKEYLARLTKAFAASKEVEVNFSGFSIMRHPTLDGIYGVSLRQGYKSERYSDDGYLFLLWDFRDKSMPLIHVRTWQPTAAVSDGNDIINISDFNFE